MTTASSDREAAFWTALPGLERDARALDLELRGRLAREWTDDALAEHASVASFNRFSLHLLAVGAPPELLVAAQRAAIDEIGHARICFALASAYAGEPRGPSPLALEGDVLGALDLASITAAAVEEGCVGETLSALEVEAARESCTNPAVRAALEVIAPDEARHAELAWTFVRWAIEVGGPSVRAGATKAMSAAIERARAGVVRVSIRDAALEPYGRLSGGRRQGVRSSALADVIEPTARELLGE